MGNCLKTQLKEEIINDNLPIFETLKLKVSSKTITDARQQKLSIKAAVDVQITANGGGYFGIGSADNIETQHYTTYTIPANTSSATDLFFKNGNYTVVIKSKYSLYSIDNAERADSTVSFNLDEVSCITGLTSLSVEGSDCSGNLKQLSKLTALTRLSIGKTAISGDIKDLNGLISLTNLYCPNCNNLYGNLGDISGLENLQVISFSNTYLEGTTASLGALKRLTTAYVNQSSLSGTVEEYVNTQINVAGISSRDASHSVFISGLLKWASFGGNNYIENYCCVTFESVSKIAVYVGETSPARCNTVYVKGYGTQEQAEAAIPGKTVIRVDA